MSEILRMYEFDMTLNVWECLVQKLNLSTMQPNADSNTCSYIIDKILKWKI